ncbi:hypothetical protein, partial [Mycolicibacterium sp.]|uniref:hypothetical protein n=1 Tax=Mycolicibacterium sp. TaxID=2320850 RepID=UPI0037C7D0A4
QELNYLNRGSDAIYSKIDGKSTAQCFGEAEGPFTFVVGVPASEGQSASLGKAVEDYNGANDPDLPIADAGGLTPADVTVPETRNKQGQAQAPDEDDGDGEDPPVDANLVYENFSGTGLLDGRALTHGPAGVVWSARENGTLGGGYYSLPDWEYDKFFITWNSALLPQLGVFEFKTKGGNVPPADGCDAGGYSWEQQYAKHWFAGPGNFWIDIKAEGGRDCGEASPLGWTDVTLAITRDDGTFVELNHYDGDNFTLPVADEMTFRLELHPSAARLYINGQLWLQADNTTLAGTVAHPKGGDLYISGGTPTMFPLDNTALDALELMLVADRAGEATAADYFYVHTDPNYRLPDQLK